MPVLPPLTRDQRLTVVAQSRAATERLTAEVARGTPRPKAVVHALAQGADLERIPWTGASRRGPSGFWGWLMGQDDAMWGPVIAQLTPAPSALTWAVVTIGHLPMLDALLAQGLDPHSGIEKQSWIEVALRHGQDAVLDRFIAAGADLAALEQHLATQPMTTLEDTLRDKAPYRWGSLLFAVTTPHGLAQVLAAHPNLAARNSSGQTPLESHMDRLKMAGPHEVTRAASESVVLGLLAAGCAVEAPSVRHAGHSWKAMDLLAQPYGRGLPAPVMAAVVARDPRMHPHPARPTVALALIEAGMAVDWERAATQWVGHWVRDESVMDTSGPEAAAEQTALVALQTQGLALHARPWLEQLAALLEHSEETRTPSEGWLLWWAEQGSPVTSAVEASLDNSEVSGMDALVGPLKEAYARGQAQRLAQAIEGAVGAEPPERVRLRL